MIVFGSLKFSAQSLKVQYSGGQVEKKNFKFCLNKSYPTWVDNITLIKH